MSVPPPISVLLSVFNGWPYIRETVDSLLRQTHADFECVIVDNLSTDGTRPYLTEVAATDSRLKLVFNAENLGHSGGLNRGLAECRGKWVARIDADDVALPNRFERQLAFASAEPDLKLTSCLAHYINATGRRVGKTFHPLADRAAFQRYMAENEMIGLLHPGVFMERELVTRLGGYRAQFGAANDIDLWCRVAEAGSLVLVQQERLMEYRVHPGQISSGKFMEQRRQYEWARACALARRSDRPEPTWEEFFRAWESAPWLQRLNRWRKNRAKLLYRDAGVAYACGYRARAAYEFLGAACLQPAYALKRLLGQLPAKASQA